MSSKNEWRGTGNLTADPEYHEGKNPRVNFSIAINERKRNKDGEFEDMPPEYVDITAFGQLADNVAASLAKGATVDIVGKWKSYTVEDKYYIDDPEDEDELKSVNVKKWSVTADKVSPSLLYATAEVTKNEKKEGSGASKSSGTSKSRPGAKSKPGAKPKPAASKARAAAKPKPADTDEAADDAF